MLLLASAFSRVCEHTLSAKAPVTQLKMDDAPAHTLKDVLQFELTIFVSDEGKQSPLL